MAAGSCMLLCEGEDIDDQLVHAEDLIAFLIEQVGSQRVDAALMAPEPAPDSVPMQTVGRGRLERKSVAHVSENRSASAPGRKMETFFIGESEPSKSAKSSISNQRERRASVPGLSCNNEKLFFIGDVKPVSKRRHSTKTFFIGEGRAPPAADIENTTPQSNARNTSSACMTPRTIRNLLAEENSPSSPCSESILPSEASNIADGETPVKRLLAFSRFGTMQQEKKEEWKKWVCTLGCTTRDPDEPGVRIAAK